jgi:hypothetical protein
MRRGWFALGIWAALITACGGSNAPSASATNQPNVSEIPARLDVVCQADGSTEVVNDEVRASPDGVHIQVDNRAGEFVSLNGTGLDFSEGVTEQIARAAPGELRVACWPGSKHTDPEPEPIAVRIHDPEGHWIPGELECPRDELIVASTLDFASNSDGHRGDLEEIVRETVEGVGSDDTIRTVGYPQAEYREVAVERNEETIALLSFSPGSNDGWLLGGYSACSSAGIRV